MVEDNKYEAKGRWFTCLIHLRRKHAAEVTHVVCYHTATVPAFWLQKIGGGLTLSNDATHAFT